MLKPSRVVRLLLPVVRKQSRKCATCENFNLNEGQEAMKANPYFTAAAQVVPPARMGKTLYTPPTEGESFEDVQARHSEVQSQFDKTAPKWRWEDFGACSFENKLVWKGDTCKAWKTALMREIKADLLGEDDDGVHGV